ncbi:hypothetical protein N9C80_08590 [Paracoccaceae bacterium]|nr:hypothetical protein [Paracoccaceae bacterium]
MAYVIRYNVKSRKQGNYYLDWYTSFIESGFKPIGITGVLQMGRNKECVLVHEAVDFGKISSWRSAARNLLSWCWYSIIFFLLIRKETRMIILSKNDYKDLDRKALFAKSFSNHLLITHTKASVKKFEHLGLNVKWLPFGWSQHAIKGINKDRKHIDVGFRGNANAKWLHSDREKTFQLFNEFNDVISTDIKISQNGEHFLYGHDYYEWLSKCKFQLNSESAEGTISPRIFEQMALRVCPLAISGDYEGLLKRYVNYIPINEENILDTLEEMKNEALVNSIIDNNEKFVVKYEISNMISECFEKP